MPLPFFTLQYCMSLNSSAFIYWELWNNVTPKSSTATPWGLCPAWNYVVCVCEDELGLQEMCHHLHFYGFTSIKLFSIQIFSAKNTKKHKQKWLIWIGSVMQYLKQQLQRLRCLCEVSEKPPENSVIVYLFFFVVVVVLFVCLVGWLFCWRWSRPHVYFCMCILSFKKVWCSFYTQTNWCLDIKQNHGVVTSVTSL